MEFHSVLFVLLIFILHFLLLSFVSLLFSILLNVLMARSGKPGLKTTVVRLLRVNTLGTLTSLHGLKKTSDHLVEAKRNKDEHIL